MNQIILKLNSVSNSAMETKHDENVRFRIYNYCTTLWADNCLHV